MTYEERLAFAERVAALLREAGRKATAEDTGGGIICVLVDAAEDQSARPALWYCGTAGETWGGSLADEATGDHLERDFETDVPSESDEEQEHGDRIVAHELLTAIRLEEATPDAPAEYAARAARGLGEDALAFASPGGGTMEHYLASARGRIKRAWEEGYRACLAQTGLVE